MTKRGSIFRACRNASLASSYSKLWSAATPRRKSGCAATDPDVGNVIAPSPPVWAAAAPSASAPCATADKPALWRARVAGPAASASRREPPRPRPCDRRSRVVRLKSGNPSLTYRADLRHAPAQDSVTGAVEALHFFGSAVHASALLLIPLFNAVRLT